MSNILIENLDERDYVGHYRREGKNGAIGHVHLKANNVTRVNDAIWDMLIHVNKGNNTFNSKLQQGRLTIIGGNELANENKSVVDGRELSYARFVGVYKQCQMAGGSGNSEISNFIDDKGIPTLEMSRENLGQQFNGQEYDSFKTRLSQELSSGMHSKTLVIPGFLPPSNDAPDPSTASDSEVSVDYNAMVEKLHSNMGDFEINDMLGRNSKPKASAYKQIQMDLSKDERDYVWKLYKEKYMKDEE